MGDVQDDDTTHVEVAFRGHIDTPTQDMEFRTEKKSQNVFMRLRRTITVEPPVLLFMFAIGLHGPALQGLTYHKVCFMDFNYDHSICSNLKNESFYIQEDEVQSGSSHWFLYQNLCFEIPAIILSFFYGSLSDHFSRKLGLVLPLIGQSMAVANYIINAVYLEMHVGYILIGQVISGCFGGWITFLLSVFSYLSEVTSKSARTSRIAIVEAVISLSIAISYFISGIVLDNTSYTVVFSISLALYILGIIYIYTWLLTLPKEEEEQRLNIVRSLKTVFTFKQLKESFTCMFKKRRNRGRLRLLVLLLCVFMSAVSYNGW